MTGMDFLKRQFKQEEIWFIESFLVQSDLGILYEEYASEQEFKEALISVLDTQGYVFPENISLKDIYNGLQNDSDSEENEEKMAEEDGPLSELEEWQMSHRDSKRDIEEDPGFDIADASNHD